MKVTKMVPSPCVMGIINVTPDSFYAASRVREHSALRERVRQILDEGGAIVDVGACSTRPGAQEVTADAELERLREALPIIVEEAEAWWQQHREEGRSKPWISVDTFRACVAEECVTRLGTDLINDISGGTLDEEMFPVVVRTGTPYILMHSRGTPQDMQQQTGYPDGVVEEVIRFFREQLARLAAFSLHLSLPLPPVVLDPGFGFAKTLEQNYELMKGLDRMRAALPDHPLLVGVSRKSMIYKLFGTDARHALNGTTVLNTYALLHGASILRVHDVKEAAEAIQLCGILA